MSRKPIKLELRGLKTPRERVWAAIMVLAVTDKSGFDRMTIQDLCVPMVGLSVVEDYTEDLVDAGYLERVPGTGGRRGVLQTPLQLRLLKPQSDAPRVCRAGKKVTQGSGTEAMWRAMKVLPSFDYVDIAKAATLGTVVVNPQTAKTYVLQLAKAGYLSTLRAGKPGTPARYRLDRNTGPAAPAITRKKVVFDRNTGESVSLQTPQEVCDGLE
jgi:hypothetical protein